MRLYKIFIALSLICLSSTGYAQKFRTPVKNEDNLKTALFELSETKQNHVFQVAMPGDNFLLIDFEKMSYWPDTNMIYTIFDIAGKVAASTKDSFSSAAHAKRIDVHVPVKNMPLQLRLNDHNDGTDMLVLNYDQQAPLKLGMDTIRVFKTLSASTDKWGEEQREELQYTFILKDLTDMIPLAENTELVSGIANTFDSVVNSKREGWSNEDTWYHSIGVRYSPMEDKDKQVQMDNMGRIFKAIDVDYYLGVSLFRNSLTPYIDVGASYKWPGERSEYNFVKLSASTLAHFERISEANYNFYNTMFLNVEMGIMVNQSRTKLPVYETSIGFGYMLSDLPSLEQHQVLKMFWNYSLSPAVRITPDIYILFRDGQENQVWAGLTVSLKFF